MICVKCGKTAPDGPYCALCGAPQQRTRNTHRRGNGQGSAYKRGKTWTGVAVGYCYTDGDLQLRRKRPTKGGFRTKGEALAWAVSYAGDSTKPMPKLIELWEGWSANDMTRLSKDKQTAYTIARTRLEPIMGRRIDTLTVDELQAVINDTCETYYPARDCKTLLSHLYKRAMASNANAGRVSLNLSRFLVLPENREAEAQPFTQAEVRTLWGLWEGGYTFAGYILVLIYTGMMPVELLTCTVPMIDFTAREIHGCGRKTKHRREAAIVFPDFLAPVLEKLTEGKKGKLIPINRDNFYKQYYDALERAGVRRLPPYSCRHTYGTEAVKLAVPPAVIAQMLRHSNTRMQERYTHLGTDEAHAAANKLVPLRGLQMVDKTG